jgi:hypothetical protein
VKGARTRYSTRPGEAHDVDGPTIRSGFSRRLKPQEGNSQAELLGPDFVHSVNFGRRPRASPLRPTTASELGRKLFIDAQAFRSVSWTGPHATQIGMGARSSADWKTKVARIVRLARLKTQADAAYLANEPLIWRATPDTDRRRR